MGLAQKEVILPATSGMIGRSALRHRNWTCALWFFGPSADRWAEGSDEGPETMKPFEQVRDSVRVQISLLIVLTSGLALMSAGIALFGYESVLQRAAASRELSARASIVAESSTAALSFSDRRAATQILEALRGDSEIVQGVIYDRNDEPFARCHRAGAPAEPARAPARAEVYFDRGYVLAFQPITLDGEMLGFVFLESRNEVGARLRRYVGIVCLILFLSQGLAWLLSARMQVTITKPLTDLASVARRISRDKDYSARAVRRSGGEVGILIDSFNHMLAQIEIRDLARRKAEESLRESEERYAVAARGANDGLWDWKLTSGEIYFSARWNEILGYAEPDRWSRPEEWFDGIHAADRERVMAEIAAHREGRTPEFSSEYRMRHRNGSYIWVLSRGIAVRDAEGRAVRMAGSQTDVTEGKIADPLTALPNRLYLADKLELSFDAVRCGGAAFAALFLDLDRFKLINDSLGHAAGDELLTGVAGRLRSCIRAAWEGRPFVAARIGGDEFAVLLNEVRDAADVETLAQRLLETLRPAFHLAGRHVFPNVSIGIALSSSGNCTEDILRNADTAMYYAKTSGGARYAIFDEAMRQRAVARLEIESGLRRAIERRELVLHYQPELSLQDRKVIGYEALVRWNHPELGMIPPNQFIPVAEETDLINDLDRWVLKEACQQMAKWHDTLRFDPPLTISVNISAKHLREHGLVEDVEQVLQETGLAPWCLNLEVTESSVVQNPEIALATLKGLKSMGVGLQIDDFGTGYSALSLLHKFPFDTVKVDRSFVQALQGGGEGLDIVRTIVDMARSFQMDIVAEGVETEDQLRHLEKLGCQYGQGFYFSKPASKATTQAAMQGRHDMIEAFAMLAKADNPVIAEPEATKAGECASSGPEPGGNLQPA